MRIGEASNPGPKKRRPRKDELIFETFNGSCNPSCLDRACRTKATILFIQEHKCVESAELDQASSLWLKAGWKAAMGPGLRGENDGPSSGTAVLVRRHIPVDYVQGPAGNDTFIVAGGRATACLVKHVVKGGFLCVSVYLEDGVGLSDSNWEVLLKVGELLARYGLPFVIGGDFNLDAQLLADSGWLRRLKAKVQRPREGTCRGSKGSYSHIDYFLVSEGLDQAVLRTEVVTAEPAKPHRPVTMALDAKPRALEELALKAPRRFPARWPIGCSPKPP